MMKKVIAIVLAVAAVAAFALFALGSASSDGEDADQGTDDAAADSNGDSLLSDCSVEILGSRLARDYEGKPIIIVKYAFTNNQDEAQSFWVAVEDQAFQGGVGLNECIFADDSAGYSADNQGKEVQKGTTLEVEVAYTLNDAATEVVVEVSSLFSFDDKKITKTFSIA